jgi:hypothetical protein
VKFSVTFKSPDACQYVIEEECERYREQLLDADGIVRLDEDELDGLVDERRHEMQAECERWFSEGEYVTVELDTETHQAAVREP